MGQPGPGARPRPDLRGCRPRTGSIAPPPAGRPAHDAAARPGLRLRRGRTNHPGRRRENRGPDPDPTDGRRRIRVGHRPLPGRWRSGSDRLGPPSARTRLAPGGCR
ncbi:MAG: hypothetical protein AVDCRST_MAG49-3177 [uncultured Thermomicrobiales bacterium]|uniref:Uncharacterized protein n=1 Tax=uncultured Thermomicrobiales bacterium TaxID=1645740 RepID=A0A6J4V3Z2_9BACT|nr:MAG: hypothetical protein AVDCRST_MAG49-3177 [uncultured Thermomicrobiales bacterium]